MPNCCVYIYCLIDAAVYFEGGFDICRQLMYEMYEDMDLVVTNGQLPP